MKTRYFFPFLFLMTLLASLIPYNTQALTVPPVDMFQLPWDLGRSWIAMDGFDNGTRRENTSPHNYNMGGAVDFAPHVGMQIGEDTSNAWVTAAADGTVTETSYCHIKILHASGWTTEYYHLGNIQVVKGAVVSRNQRLAIIDNNEKAQVCVGNRWPGPHLHFVLRPNMRDATLAGWQINYDQVTNITTFTKNGQTVGSFQPILNEMTVVIPTTVTPVPTTQTPTVTSVPTTETSTVTSVPTTETPTVTSVPTTETPTVTSVPTTETPTVTSVPTTETPTVTSVPTTVTPTTVTPTLPTGLYVITVGSPASMFTGDTVQIKVYLNNVPLEGLTSVEFTCTYDPSLLEVSNIADGGLFGADAAAALNGPQNGKFIFAVAGSNGRRAASSGLALTFNAKGLQTGQSVVECKARVSTGNGLLVDIPSIPDTIKINPPLPVTGTVAGNFACCKPVTIRLYNADNVIVATTLANAGISFSLTVPAGTYTITASAEGFLSAQGTANVANGTTITMPMIALPAGDIDGNGVIDQYDAMTIGMNYNAASPSAADLNCDSVINVLDLEALAANYRKSGALMWQ